MFIKFAPKLMLKNGMQHTENEKIQRKVRIERRQRSRGIGS